MVRCRLANFTSASRSFRVLDGSGLHTYLVPRVKRSRRDGVHLPRHGFSHPQDVWCVMPNTV